MRDGKTLPPQATGIPIFSTVEPQLRAAALRSLVDAAFENLILAREQATLEQELLRARAEIDQLNQIGIALSTQRDSRSFAAAAGVGLESLVRVTSSHKSWAPSVSVKWSTRPSHGRRRRAWRCP